MFPETGCRTSVDRVEGALFLRFLLEGLVVLLAEVDVAVFACLEGEAGLLDLLEVDGAFRLVAASFAVANLGLLTVSCRTRHASGTEQRR